MRYVRLRSVAPVHVGDSAVRSGAPGAGLLLTAIVATATLVMASPAHATNKEAQATNKEAHASATASPSKATNTAAHPARVSPYIVWRHQHDEAERAAGPRSAQRPQGQSSARRLPN